ncbi:hypothetical protein V1512DRAFT_265822 [Lipomyces arxii]|uniref:uncharacterized protein n=1 Tax=Lipomyces arxii TaxID=56418 RepID=UPI0034CF15FA
MTSEHTNEADPVERIYYYYEVARGFASQTDDPSSAYVKILEYSSPSADKRARVLANSFIPDLFSRFASEQRLASRAVESMIDFCEDEDPKLRVGTIKRLPEIAELSQSEADKELIVDILIQLMQSQAPAELDVVKASLERAARSLPGVTARKIWRLAASATSEPVLQKIAKQWIMTTGKNTVGQYPEFAEAGIAAVKGMNDVNLFETLCGVLQGLPTLKDTKRVGEMLDVLVSDCPSADSLSQADDAALDKFAALLRQIGRLVYRQPPLSALIKYLATIIPVLGSSKLRQETQHKLLTLAYDCCLQTPPSRELDIFIPKLKDLVISLSTNLDDAPDWTSIEPATLALQSALFNVPGFPLSSDASPDLTPALRRIWAQAHTELSNLRKLDAQTTESEKQRRQCENTVTATRELLKLPSLRAKEPLKVYVSWRPLKPVTKKRPNQTSQTSQANQTNQTSQTSQTSQTNKANQPNKAKKTTASEKPTSRKKRRGRQT